MHFSGIVWCLLVDRCVGVCVSIFLQACVTVCISAYVYVHICTFLAMNVHLYMHLSLCFHICSGLYKFSCMYSIFVYMGLCIFSSVSVCYYLYGFFWACVYSMCVNVCPYFCVYLNSFDHTLFNWMCSLPFVHEYRKYPAFLCMEVFFHLYASCVHVCRCICVLNMSLYMCVCLTTSIWALEFPYLYAHACTNVFVSMNTYVH